MTRRRLGRLPFLLLFTMLALLGGAAPPSAAAQSARAVKPSQGGAVEQTIGDTRIEIRYNRPVARGRTLFGGVVPWGKVWCPGADSATTIAFSTPVKVNGAPVAPGTYSVWAIPGPEQWSVILSRAAHVFHIPYPAGHDALRVAVAPRRGAHMETLAFYFPVVEGRTAELWLHWGTTIVPLSIVVP
ncbi:MAG TPA: DUF2911 domain-containing protein [Gemmatimonadales bacterium]|nr:DUF2911 domain-containing protein [Gemmatimonadales bacterium]